MIKLIIKRCSVAVVIALIFSLFLPTTVIAANITVKFGQGHTSSAKTGDVTMELNENNLLSQQNIDEIASASYTEDVVRGNTTTTNSYSAVSIIDSSDTEISIDDLFNKQFLDNENITVIYNLISSDTESDSTSSDKSSNVANNNESGNVSNNNGSSNVANNNESGNVSNNNESSNVANNNESGNDASSSNISTMSSSNFIIDNPNTGYLKIGIIFGGLVVFAIGITTAIVLKRKI